jgi:hypothetical protein
VQVVAVQKLVNKKHLVTAVMVEFNGPVNAGPADKVTNYQLVAANRKGQFSGKGAILLGLRSAVSSAANNTVTLTLRKPFAATSPAQLTVNGSAPSGLTDILGRLIDGRGDGTAGGNAIAVIGRGGVTLNP